MNLYLLNKVNQNVRIVNGIDSFDSFLTFVLPNTGDFANLSNKYGIFLVLRFKPFFKIIYFLKCHNK